MTAEQWGAWTAIVAIPLSVAAVIYLGGAVAAWRRPLPRQLMIRRWSGLAAVAVGALCFAAMAFVRVSPTG
jgi:hypothetical protein